jgi:hypothetical protein
MLRRPSQMLFLMFGLNSACFGLAEPFCYWCGCLWASPLSHQRTSFCIVERFLVATPANTMSFCLLLVLRQPSSVRPWDPSVISALLSGCLKICLIAIPSGSRLILTSTGSCSRIKWIYIHVDHLYGIHPLPYASAPFVGCWYLVST